MVKVIGRVEEGRGGLRLGQSLRFPFSLIKPDVPISGIRLSDWLHCTAHGGGARRTRRSRNTCSSPKTCSRENRFVPRPCTLCRLRRKCRTRSPDYPCCPSNVPCPLPRRTEQGHASMACLFVLPSPSVRWVGVRIGSFEACSGCTRVTARRIAQPPEAAFVTRLRPGQSPSRTARQLPDSSTIIRVEPPSTSNTRLRGALHVSP